MASHSPSEGSNAISLIPNDDSPEQSPRSTNPSSAIEPSRVGSKNIDNDEDSAEMMARTSVGDPTDTQVFSVMGGLPINTGSSHAFALLSTAQHAPISSDEGSHLQDIKHHMNQSERSTLPDKTAADGEVAAIKTGFPTESTSAMDIDQRAATVTKAQQAGATGTSSPLEDSKQEADSLFIGKEENTTIPEPFLSNKRSVDAMHKEHDDAAPEARGVKRFKPSPANSSDSHQPPKIGKDGKVVPYDPSGEERPRCAAYDPGFSSSEAFVTSIAKDAKRACDQAKASGLDNEEIERISESLVNYLSLHNQYPESKPVAFLGPAGTGKSTTINSILNQMAAAESGSATRGTNLVHEYLSPAPEQVTKYVVAAQYLGSAELGRFIKKHADNIFKFIEKQRKNGDEDDNEELQQSCGTSMNIFHVLLCDLEDFEIEEDIAKYFESNIDDREAVYEGLEEDINNLKASRNLEHDVEYHEANNRKELADKFRLVSRVPQVTTGQAMKPHPWPIIRKIKVHTDNELLNAGLLLGDTPGTNDTNQAVVDSTTNYIRNAGLVLITEPVKRILDSKTLNGNIRKLIQLNKPNNICLIVTCIDGLAKMSEEERDEIADDDKRLLETVESHTARLRAEESDLNRQMNAGQMGATNFDFPKVWAELKAIEPKIASAERKKGETIMEIKTRDIKSKLRDRVRTVSRSRHSSDLEVIFISNTEYYKHVQGYDLSTPPILDVNATGVPALRRRLFEEPAVGKGTRLKFICVTHLPKLLMSIIGVLTKSKLERKEEVEKVVASHLRKYRAILDRFFDELVLAFENTVINFFEKEFKPSAPKTAVADAGPKLIEKADKLADEWSKLNARTFEACCKKGGVHTAGKTKVLHDWNNRIQSIFIEKASEAFDEFQDQVKVALSMLIGNTRGFFDNLITELKVNQDFQGVKGQEHFIDLLRSTCDEVTHSMQDKEDAMLSDLHVVRNRCLFEPDEGSFVSESMLPTYHACANLSIVQPQQKGTERKKGRGGARKSSTHLARVELLREKLNGKGKEPSVFMNVAQKAKKAFHVVATDWTRTEYARLLEEAAKEVKTEFGRRFAVNEEDIKQNNPKVAEKLKLDIVGCLAKAQGPLRDSIGRWDTIETHDR